MASGSKWGFDPLKVIVDPAKPLLDGGIGPGGIFGIHGGSAGQYAARQGIDLRVPFEKLPKKTQNVLLNGAPDFRASSACCRRRSTPR